MTEPTRLSDGEIQDGLTNLNGWELRDGRLRKQFTFRTFLRAIAFVNSVAYLAESAGHHPDITINYNKVTLGIITHSAGALTDRENSQNRRRHGEHRDSPQIHIMRSRPSPRALLGAISQGSSSCFRTAMNGRLRNRWSKSSP